MVNLFKRPSTRFRRRLMKAWDESKHPRDNRGRWTSTGSGLGLTVTEESMLSTLRGAAEPLRFIPSDEGQGVRIDGGPWRKVNLKRIGYDRSGYDLHTFMGLFSKDLVRNHRGDVVLVRMVDQRDWWNP